MAAMSVSQSGSFVPDSGKAKIAAASVFALLDQKSKIDYTEESGTTLQNVKGDIEFIHVNFKYPSRPDIQIFKDLCLTIHSGQVFYEINYTPTTIWTMYFSFLPIIATYL